MTEIKPAAAGGSGAATLFSRRIEFHPARKPYSPISSAGGDFRLETLNPGAASGSKVGTEAAAAPEKRGSSGGGGGGELIERGFDPELSFRTSIRRIGAGLQNLGNTCFLNSVLQCLTYTEPFAAYLQSGKHKSSCHTAGFCAMCALQNHVLNALQSTGKILSPFDLVKNLRCISRNFRNSRQEDAHEYMVNLLESMHRCCIPSGVPSESPSAYEKSLVHKIFGGSLRSQVKCTQCSYCSNKYDPFLDLSLEIRNADSLSKALKHFTALEQLDDGERHYQCQRCKQKVRALKQLTIHNPPYVLTIHLKRFSYDSHGEKINKKVEFAPALDLKPFVSELHEGNLKYTLYGVLVHAGWNTHSGHYYCFIRTASGMWHSLDDNKVTQVSEKTVYAQKAYMLFYVRDRSSVIKRSVDVAHKDNVPANRLTNRVFSQPGSNVNGSIQNSLADTNFMVPLQDCAKPKTDSTTNGSLISLADNSLEQLVQNKALFQKNDESLAPVLTIDGHAADKEGHILPRHIDVLSKGLQQETLPDDISKLPSTKDSLANGALSKKVKEELSPAVQSKDSTPFASHTNNASIAFKDVIQSKDLSELASSKAILCKRALCNKVNEGLISTVQSKDSNVVVSHTNNASFAFKNGVVSHETYQFSNGCQVEVKSVNLVAQANNSDILNITSSEKPPPLHDMHEGVNFETGKCLGSKECQNGEESPQMMEEVKVNLLEKPTVTSLQKEVNEVAVTDYSVGGGFEADKNQKKLAKSSLARIMKFGSKKLFLSSLSLQNNKKRKRCRKRRSSSRNMLRGELLEDAAQMASTSVSSRVVRDYVRPTKKCPHSNSKREINASGGENIKTSRGDSEASRATRDSIHPTKKRPHSSVNVEIKTSGGEKSNGDSVSLKDRLVLGEKSGQMGEKSGQNSTLTPTFEPPNGCPMPALNQCDTPQTDGMVLLHRQDDFLSLLTRKPAVAGWDDSSLELFQRHKDTQNNNIGYVLDEWDEELDRGKQKKLKKPRQSYDGANLFQETANMKAQQRIKAVFGPTVQKRRGF